MNSSNYFISVPTSHPLNVSGFLNNSKNVIVTWKPVPVDHHQGIILGYHVMYVVQTSGHQQQITVNAPSTSVELQNLQKYTLYNISVAAFTTAGQGPPSPAIVVRSEESGKLETKVIIDTSCNLQHALQNYERV